MPLLTLDQAYIGLAMMLRTIRGWIAEDDGLDESPSKLLYIAAGIIVAGLVIGVAYKVFGSAERAIPDPVVPPAP
jgi:4-hydroxybenzoate polyprenyltransferase